MDEQQLKEKARELCEMLLAHHGEAVVEHYLPLCEDQVREFYENEGRWPVFKRNPEGHGQAVTLE
jgi:hypothetical protein